MGKRALFAATFLATVSLMAVFATSAYAHAGVSFPSRCDNSSSNCHVAPGTNPVATLVSNNGSTATYNISGGGLEWAVFSGTSRMAGQPGPVGQFTVPVGATYTLFAVSGFPGPLGITTLNLGGAPPARYTITASAGSNGSISPGSQTVNDGTAVTYSVTANTGYHIADVRVDGASVGAVSTYRFPSVHADHTISASFATDVVMYTITASAAQHGSITPGSVTLPAGSGASYTITAAAGAHITTVMVDGVSVGAVGTYQFSDLGSNHTIFAYFALDPPPTFSIVATAGADGAISPDDSQTVVGGTDASFLMAPDPGFHVADVLVDGGSVGAIGSYSFVNVQQPHTIAVVFAPNQAGTFSITPSAGLHGSISPAQIQTVSASDDVTFTFLPDPGYHVATVTVDSVPVPTSSTYAFTDVQGDHTIAVTFAITPKAATTLSLSSSHSSVRHGKTVKLSSVLRRTLPAGYVAAQVRYEVKKPGSKTWVLLAKRTASSKGASSWTTRLSKRGTYSYRVRFLGSAGFLASTSRTVKVKSK